VSKQSTFVAKTIYTRFWLGLKTVRKYSQQLLCRSSMKNRDFRQMSRFILETMQGMATVAIEYE